ncbi:hypothetical protein [Sphaerothrix gracilis]|uniref:hypothetical protein n=1 Tax=Sphaerothrix gracilis TaxID=3151835 RepID=UPI0031FCA414
MKLSGKNVKAQQKTKSQQGALDNHIFEKPLSSAQQKEIQKELHLERTRRSLIRWGGFVFIYTIAISGALTFAAAFFPEQVDSEPIKDWSNLMISTQMGLGGAVIGYYFGCKNDH